MTNENLKLWDSVQMTDPKYTKQFTRGGGFKGAATNATWQHKRATEVFGPIGIGWGVTVVDEKYAEAQPGVKVHVVRIKLWYLLDGKRGEIEAFGQTEFCGKRSNGNAYVDEEAPKKSLTDATSKALSLLGFAADIHLGLFDDNKYVNEAKKEWRDDDLGAARNDNEPAKQSAGKSTEAGKADNQTVDDYSDQGGVSGGNASHDGSSSYDDKVALEQRLKTAIDKCETSKAVINLMTNAKTKKALSDLDKKVEEGVREYGRKRMAKLAEPAEAAAS